MRLSMSHARSCMFGLAISVLLLALPVSAQVTIPQEYHQTIKSAEAVGALGADLFGEQVNLYTGTTSFAVTDVSRPGNNALPVAVGRRFVVESRILGTQEPYRAFLDWDLDIPHMHGVFAFGSNSGEGSGWRGQGAGADMYKRCSMQTEPPFVTGYGAPEEGVFGPEEYWHGNSLYVPGVGDQEILTANNSLPEPSDGMAYYWATKNRWYFSCLPNTANGVPGEGFIAVAPDGTRYRFDWVVSRYAAYVKKPFGQLSSGNFAPAASSSRPKGGAEVFPTAVQGATTAIGRDEVWILPTRVEDRFGNSVTYTYDGANPWRLLAITGSDGRQLTLTYNASGYVDTVSDGARIWRYSYGERLSEVVLPDQSKWTFSVSVSASGPDIRPYAQGDVVPLCDHPAMGGATNPYTLQMQHPSGASGEFVFLAREHGRSYVQKSCQRYGTTADEGEWAYFPYRFATWSISSKTITGAGLPTQAWTYSYGPLNYSWAQDCPNNTCPSTKTVEVAGPDNQWTRYTFGNRYRDNEGKLLKVEVGTSANNIMRTEAMTYQLNAQGQLYPEVVGWSLYGRVDTSATHLTPLTQRITTQQGRNFTWRVDATCGGNGAAYCFDQFARPTKVTKSSSP